MVTNSKTFGQEESSITDAILCYIKTPHSGALMISGKWGCGKTHHIDHVVFPKLRELDYVPIRVSLFGMSNIDEFPSKLLDAYIDSYGKSLEKNNKESLFNKKTKAKAGKLLMKGATALSSLKKITDVVDVEKLFRSNNDFYYRFIPSDKTILVLDDLERAIKTIDIHTLLGAINDLIEQREYKVVVVSNNTYLDDNNKDHLVFKEKVIEKTIVYQPDIKTIYKKLLDEGGYNDDYKSFMLQKDCVSIIDPNNTIYRIDKVKDDLCNIRILKFSLSHFYKVFLCLWIKQEDKSDEDFVAFIKSLWACTIGLSTYYKKNELTDKDKNAYVSYIEMPEFVFDKNEDESVNELFDTEEDKKQRQHDITSSEKIRKMYQTYVKSNGLKPIISIELFDLITAGYSLEESGLIETWNHFKEESLRNKRSPAYLLLDKFLKAIWTFTNDEMPQKLNELASYVESGDFVDNLSYINAATYLLHYQPLCNYSTEELNSKLKTGIDKMYSQMTDIHPVSKSSLNIFEGQIPELSKWVLEYEKEKMEETITKKTSEDVKVVCEQFNHDLDALAKRLTPNYGNTNTPDFLDYPILAEIPEDIVINKMKNITPSEIMSLSSIIDWRLLNMRADNEEVVFVSRIKNGISQRDTQSKVFADYLIEDHLNKYIDKIIPSI